MVILILGGRGNLGTQLTEVFSSDYEIVSWDRDDLDVLDSVLLVEKIRKLRPAVIINTIAFNAVDLCENKAEYLLAAKLNEELPAILADLALDQQAVLVHYSSDYVFNGTKLKQSFTEEETPNPINKYGESKAQGEREIIRRASLGLKYYLIRTSKLFGPAGLSSAAKPSFFDIMLKLAQSKSELTVVDEELSCFTYTLDLAQATKRLWELEVPFGIYHIINEGPCTWYEAAAELFRLKKEIINIRAVRSENLLRAARRPKFSVLQNTKIKKLRNWREALKEYLHT
ncbi:MAG: NAD(P)-dependent oxidoreductase [Patescibacteria group bacterium]|jgi:dTDP-4-dehydrorhamnose reductase